MERRLPPRLPPGEIERAFIGANPAPTRDGVTVTCRHRRFREVRVSPSKDLAPRPCTGSVAPDCEIANPLFAPMR